MWNHGLLCAEPAAAGCHTVYTKASVVAMQVCSMAWGSAPTQVQQLGQQDCACYRTPRLTCSWSARFVPPTVGSRQTKVLFCTCLNLCAE